MITTTKQNACITYGEYVVFAYNVESVFWILRHLAEVVLFLLFGCFFYERIHWEVSPLAPAFAPNVTKHSVYSSTES